MPFVSTDSATYDAATNTYSFAIPETARAGAVVGQVRFEHEGLLTGSYATFGPNAGRFEIDDDGTMRLAGGVSAVDSIGNPRTDLSVQVSFLGTAVPEDLITARTITTQTITTQTITVQTITARTAPSRITVTDMGHAPVITVAESLSAINEDADLDTIVATFDAYDPDGDPVTLALSGPQSGLFAIEQRHFGSHRIVLKDPDGLDYESLGSDKTITLTVTASSQASGQAARQVQQQISFRVNDVDEAVGFSQNMFTYRVDENVAGAELGALVASGPDGDPITFTLTGGNAGLFEITDGNRVKLRDGVSLDHEALTNGHVDVWVIATAAHTFADGRTSTTTDTAIIRVNVTNLVEAPIVSLTMPAQGLAEHAAAGTPVAGFTVEDHGQGVALSLAGAQRDLFRIDGDRIVVADADALDFETLSGGLDLQLVAWPTIALAQDDLDYDGLSTTTVVPVQLRDVDDAVRFAQKFFEFTLPENAAPGTLLGNARDVIRAVDPDGDAITYSLSFPDQRTGTATAPGAMPFILNDDGRLEVAAGADIDFEALGATNGHIGLSITATATRTNADGTVTTTSDSALVSIRVTNVDEGPVFMDADGRPTQTIGTDIDEFSRPFSQDRLLTTLNAVDPEGDTPVIYHRTGGDARLKLVGNKLYLKAGSVLDYEVDGNGISVDLVAYSRASGGTPQVTRKSFTVAVNDVDERPTALTVSTPHADNDTRPRWTTIEVDEGAQPDKLADIVITDDALGTNSLKDLPADSVFEYRNVTRTGAELWLKPDAVLDYETATRHVARIRLDGETTGTGGRLPQQQKFVLRVADVAEGPNIHDLTAAHAEVSQHDLSALLATATRVTNFDAEYLRLRFADGATEIWVRQVGDAEIAGGRSTLVTAFNGTTGQVLHYAVLTGYTDALTSVHLDDDDIAIKNSIIGTRKHDWTNAIRGTDMDDHIDGGSGDDRLYGGAGDDTLTGGAGVNELRGGVGNDTLIGGTRHDRLYGGAGDDTLIGGEGGDNLTGGAGDDIFDISESFFAHRHYNSVDWIVDFTPGRHGDVPLADGGDKIRIAEATIIGYRVIEQYRSDRADGTLLYDGTDPNGQVFGYLRGFAGPLFLSDFTGDVTAVTAIDDSSGLTLTGGAGVNELRGGAGDDTLTGGRYNRLTGGSGDDIFNMSYLFSAHSGYNEISRIMDFTPGRHGDAPLAGSGDKIRIAGATTIGYRGVDHKGNGLGYGTMLYDGADPDGRIFGFLFDFTGPLFLSDFTGDVTTVTAIDDSNGLTLTGGDGHDSLYGSAGDDTLIGGAGDDDLVAGPGRNMLTGNAGADRFYLSNIHNPGGLTYFKTLSMATHIADFNRDEGDEIFVDGYSPTGGPIVNTVHYRHQDVDGDGNIDTVLSRVGARSAVYGVIDDYQDDLTADDIGNASTVIFIPDVI